MMQLRCTVEDDCIVLECDAHTDGTMRTFMAVNKAQIKSLNYVLESCFRKLFGTKSTEILIYACTRRPKSKGTKTRFRGLPGHWSSRPRWSHLTRKVLLLISVL